MDSVSQSPMQEILTANPDSTPGDGAPQMISGSTNTETFSPSPASSWMEHAAIATPPVSFEESASLSALIAHVARKSGASEFRVERDVADRFNVANVKFLPQAHFEAALFYLTALAGEYAAESCEFTGA